MQECPAGALPRADAEYYSYLSAWGLDQISTDNPPPPLSGSSTSNISLAALIAASQTNVTPSLRKNILDAASMKAVDAMTTRNSTTIIDSATQSSKNAVHFDPGFLSDIGLVAALQVAARPERTAPLVLPMLSPAISLAPGSFSAWEIDSGTPVNTSQFSPGAVSTAGRLFIGFSGAHPQPSSNDLAALHLGAAAAAQAFDNTHWALRLLDKVETKFGDRLGVELDASVVLQRLRLPGRESRELKTKAENALHALSWVQGTSEASSTLASLVHSGLVAALYNPASGIPSDVEKSGSLRSAMQWWQYAQYSYHRLSDGGRAGDESEVGEVLQACCKTVAMTHSAKSSLREGNSSGMTLDSLPIMVMITRYL